MKHYITRLSNQILLMNDVIIAIASKMEAHRLHILLVVELWFEIK